MRYNAVTAKLMAMGAKSAGPQAYSLREAQLKLAADIARISMFLPDNGARSAFGVFCLRLDLRVEREKQLCAAKGLAPPYSAAELLILQKRLGPVSIPQDGLEMYYHKRLNAEAKRNRRDGWLLRHIAGIEADLHNILSIYRLKTYYKASAGAVYPHLIKGRGKLSPKDVQTLTEASGADIKAGILATPYGSRFAKAFDGGEWPETAALNVIIQEVRCIMKKKPDSLARALLYVYKRERFYG
ncbi:MAG: V-type ATPase subunit [Clostridiales bacterium]|jgi:hypothetical protein|nr:V-type ATPase subunit [Clostridiales bacterium]